MIGPYTWETYLFKLFSRKPYLGLISTEGFQAEHVNILIDRSPRAMGRFRNNDSDIVIEMTIRQSRREIMNSIMIAVACVILGIVPLMGVPSGPDTATVLLFASILLVGRTLILTYEVQHTKRFFRELLEDSGEAES